MFLTTKRVSILSAFMLLQPLPSIAQEAPFFDIQKKLYAQCDTRGAADEKTVSEQIDACLQGLRLHAVALSSAFRVHAKDWHVAVLDKSCSQLPVTRTDGSLLERIEHGKKSVNACMMDLAIASTSIEKPLGEQYALAASFLHLLPECLEERMSAKTPYSCKKLQVFETRKPTGMVLVEAQKSDVPERVMPLRVMGEAEPQAMPAETNKPAIITRRIAPRNERQNESPDAGQKRWEVRKAIITAERIRRQAAESNAFNTVRLFKLD